MCRADDNASWHRCSNLFTAAEEHYTITVTSSCFTLRVWHRHVMSCCPFPFLVLCNSFSWLYGSPMPPRQIRVHWAYCSIKCAKDEQTFSKRALHITQLLLMRFVIGPKHKGISRRLNVRSGNRNAHATLLQIKQLEIQNVNLIDSFT